MTDPDRREFWGLSGSNWLFPVWAMALGVAIAGDYYRYRGGEGSDCGVSRRQLTYQDRRGVRETALTRR